MPKIRTGVACDLASSSIPLQGELQLSFAGHDAMCSPRDLMVETPSQCQCSLVTPVKVWQLGIFFFGGGLAERAKRIVCAGDK